MGGGDLWLIWSFFNSLVEVFICFIIGVWVGVVGRVGGGGFGGGVCGIV